MLIVAQRNVHKSFVSAAAMLDLTVEWLPSDGNYLSSLPRLCEIERMLLKHEPAALYITSPDYLGKTADVSSISKICRRLGVPLIVDNAHGAYQKFLEPSRHPIDLGADMCCDSAHKTLPVLTGGAYLHISKNASPLFSENARLALSLFGSTSPSYIILSSLDRANGYILGDYKARLAECCAELDALKERLGGAGYMLYGDEPLKLTVMPKSYGYRGTELADILYRLGIVCEFADPDYTVFMITPENTDESIAKLEEALLALERRAPIDEPCPKATEGIRIMPIREAVLSPSETVAVSDSLGRVLSAVTVGCPPAVPIAVSGELITEQLQKAFEYYGITELSVTKKL